jgi:hypothetical protein
MFLGHYGVAFAAKRAAPRTSLGTLTFAAQLLDELWPIFLLLGLERVRIAPGLMAANSLDFVHYPISHSLVTAIGWAVVAGIVYHAVRRYGRGAWVVGAAVLSHWLLDVPMHRPDLPLWPGSSILVGAGLWNSVPATLVIEGALLAIGLAIYLRTTRARDRVGSWGLWAMVAVLVLIYLGTLFGAPPPSERALAVTTLGLWLFVPWSYWVDRHREVIVAPARAEAEAERGGSEVRTRPTMH